MSRPQSNVPDGLTILQTADRLTLKPTLRSNALGALSWCLLVWVPLFLIRLALVASGVHLSRSLGILLTYGGPFVWPVAFAYLVLRPPIVIHRVEEVGKVARRLAQAPIAAKGFVVLGSGPASGKNRVGRRIMFAKPEEASWVADRINAFLGL